MWPFKKRDVWGWLAIVEVRGEFANLLAAMARADSLDPILFNCREDLIRSKRCAPIEVWTTIDHKHVPALERELREKTGWELVKVKVLDDMNDFGSDLDPGFPSAHAVITPFDR